MKILKSILILSLIMCVCVCAYAGETLMKHKDAEPYEIGKSKKIEIHNTFTISYSNQSTSGKEVTLTGSIEINRRFKIVQLDMDYYILDRNQKPVRATNLNLAQDAPGVYTFKYTYPLHLKTYEFELFSLIFIVEEVDTQSI